MVKINLAEVFYSFSKALDLALIGISYHHQSVAIIALAIAEHLDLTVEQREQLFYSSLVHDAGMDPDLELTSLLPFEDANSLAHCRKGYEIFRHSSLTSAVAEIILHHHDKWQGASSSTALEANTLASNIVYLADRVSVLVEHCDKHVLHCKNEIIDKIQRNSGELFNPLVVDAFLEAAATESFWLDVQSKFLLDLVNLKKPKSEIEIPVDELLNLAFCFSQVIDNKSPYTHNHSQTVAIVAEYLAGKIGFSPAELVFIKIAGYLHDLGKLSVPNHILNKPEKLTEEEYSIIKQHTYYTYYLLNNISGLELAAYWASQHHEKLNGSGYPFRLDNQQLSLGSKIMAVSDIFAALIEERPYRKGMDRAECLSVLAQLAANNEIDQGIVALVENNYQELMDLLTRS